MYQSDFKQYNSYNIKKLFQMLHRYCVLYLRNLCTGNYL